MRRVRITVSIASHDWSFSPQEDVIVTDRFRSRNETHPGEIPADVVDAWLSVGHAVEIPEPKGPAPVEAAVVEAPEVAVADSAESADVEPSTADAPKRRGKKK